MASKIKLSVILCSLFAALILPAVLRAEPVLTGPHPLAQDILVPGRALERHGLTQLAVASMVVGNTTVGVVAVYDDPTTVRHADYLELYDDTGRLLAVSWFDRFGIERVAADRGFLKGKGEVEGLFVMLLNGDPV